MTVLLTDYDSTIAVKEEWFICANTCEFVMRSETCSGRFNFTIRAVTLSGSHILTHTPSDFASAFLITIQIGIEKQITPQSCGLHREFWEKPHKTWHFNQQNYYNNIQRTKRALFSLLPEETDTTGCPSIFTFVNTKKLLITFDFLFYHICYHTNINCNITVPWHW